MHARLADAASNDAQSTPGREIGLAGGLTSRLHNHMVMDDMTADQLSAVFGALADPTRRAILARLADGDANVAELAAPFTVSQPAISKHLKVLEAAGLVSRTRRATARLSHLEAEPLREATEWLGGLSRVLGREPSSGSTRCSRRSRSDPAGNANR